MILNSIYKVFRSESGVAERGLQRIFSKIKQNADLKNISSSNFFSKTLCSWSPEAILSRRQSFPVKCSRRYNSAQAAVLKNEKDVHTKSNFQEMMQSRKMQAHRSILVEIAVKEDIPFAVAYCEKYGSIANAYSYPGEGKNCFLLLEFSTEDTVQKLLSNCGFQNIDDVFPVCSRLIRFQKKPNSSLPQANIIINEESNLESSLKSGASLSEVIEDIYSTETLTELDIRLRFFLCALMKDSISGFFPHSDVLPFGSSVNGIGKRGCDLDVVIRLYPDKVNGDGDIFFLNKTCVGKHKSLQQRTLSRLGEYFIFSPGVSLMDRIMFARVPILKMRHKILNLDFDVSVNNVSAVHMSDMLHFCGEIDPRVRPLMHIVKKWAKEANITKSTPGAQISNFGLANLVLYFLQRRKPHAILPSLSDAVLIQGSDNTYNFRLQYLKSIENWKANASLNKEPLAVLLKDFFLFLSTYTFHDKIISLMVEETRSHNENRVPFYVQYPLDESLNIMKNVSIAEYDIMCEKAKLSARNLESSLKRTVNNMTDFSAILGIPTVSRISLKPAKFNVNSIIENEKTLRNRNIKYKI